LFQRFDPLIEMRTPGAQCRQTNPLHYLRTHDRLGILIVWQVSNNALRWSRVLAIIDQFGVRIGIRNLLKFSELARL